MAALDRLVTRWMNGVLFYLDTDIPIVHGHTIYIDSEWALTSISQAQFWRDVDVGRYGDGNVRGILSVDVSDWDTPGRRTGKVASRCSRDEIRAEVWGQLADHLNDGPQPLLDESRVLAWFLDPAIEFPNPTEATNLEPLLINTARIVERQAGGDDTDRQPDAGRRLRADEHRPGDDGGGQRGGPPRGQRNPRRHRFGRSSLRGVRADRAGGPAPRPPSRPAALVVVPSPRPRTAARQPRRRIAASRCARACGHRAGLAQPAAQTTYRVRVSEALALADSYWAYYRRTAQLWNIDRGDVDEIERWEDLSASGVAERVRRLGEFAERAEGSTLIDSHDEDLALMAAVSFSAAATASSLPWMRNRGLVAGPFNFATFLSVLVPGYSLVTRSHGDGYIAKLNAVPFFVDGWVDGLRDGLSSGQTATARGLANAITEYDRLLGTDVSEDPLAGQEPPTEFTDFEVDAWRDEVITTIRRSVRPAVARLRDVLRLELLPRCELRRRAWPVPSP